MKTFKPVEKTEEVTRINMDVYLQKLNSVRVAIVDIKDLKFIKGNRQLKERKVVNIMEAIVKNNLLHLCPLLINSNNEVADGQHREEAMNRLEITKCLCLISDDADLSAAETLNQNGDNWSTYDFGYSKAEQGNPHYIMYMEFMKKYGIKSQEAMQLLNGHPDYAGFKRGEFIVKNREKANRIATMLQDFKYYIPKQCGNRSFVAAFATVCETPGYDHGNMMRKMEVLPLRKCADKALYLAELSKIYNYQTGRVSRLRFKD